MKAAVLVLAAAFLVSAAAPARAQLGAELNRSTFIQLRKRETRRSIACIQATPACRHPERLERQHGHGNSRDLLNGRGEHRIL